MSSMEGVDAAAAAPAAAQDPTPIVRMKLAEMGLSDSEKAVTQFCDNIVNFLYPGDPADFENRLNSFARIIPLFKPWSLRSRTREEVIQRADMFGFAIAFERATVDRKEFTFLCLAKKDGPGPLTRVQVILFGNERAGGLVEYMQNGTDKVQQRNPARSRRAEENQVFYVVPGAISDSVLKMGRYAIDYIVENTLKSFKQCSCTFAEGPAAFWDVREKMRMRRVAGGEGEQAPMDLDAESRP